MYVTLRRSPMRHVLFPIWALNYEGTLQLHLRALEAYYMSFPDRPIPDFDCVPATGNITPEAFTRAVFRDIKTSLQSEKTTFPRLCHLVVNTKIEHWIASRKSARMYRQLIDKITAVCRTLICTPEDDQLLSRSPSDGGNLMNGLTILAYVRLSNHRFH